MQSMSRLDGKRIGVIVGVVLLGLGVGLVYRSKEVPPCTPEDIALQQSGCLGALEGHRVTFSADGTMAVTTVCSQPKDYFSCTEGTIHLWQVEGCLQRSEKCGLLLHSFRAHAGWVRTIAFSPDGMLLASAGCAEQEKDRCKVKGEISLWQVGQCNPPTQQCGALRYKWLGHSRAVNQVAFSPDGKLLASAGKDNATKLWPVSKCTPLADTCETSGRTLAHSWDVFSVAFSPDGTLLATGSARASLWRVSDGLLLGTVQGSTSSVSDVAFIPNGEILATANRYSSIGLWQVSGCLAQADSCGQLVQSLTVENMPMWRVNFSSDGNRLVAVSAIEGQLKQWQMVARINQYEPLSLDPTLPVSSQMHDAIFSPDGKILALDTPVGIQLWSVQN